MWGSNRDDPSHRRICIEIQSTNQLDTILFWTAYVFWWLVADNTPEVIATFDRLHSADQTAHAVPYQNHLIQRRVSTIRIDRITHLRKVFTQLRRTDPKRLARGI